AARGAGRHAQLIEAGNRYGASRCGAERSGVGQAIDGRRQGRDIRDVVRARIIAVEEVKELDERYNGTALTKAEGPAHPHVNLDVRGSNQLVEAGLDSVDHGTVVLGVSKTIHVHRSGDRERPCVFRLTQQGYLEAGRHLEHSRHNEPVESVFSRPPIVTLPEGLQWIADAVDVVKQFTERAAPRLGTGERVVHRQVETPRDVSLEMGRYAVVA